MIIRFGICIAPIKKMHKQSLANEILYLGLPIAPLSTLFVTEDESFGLKMSYKPFLWFLLCFLFIFGGIGLGFLGFCLEHYDYLACGLFLLWLAVVNFFIWKSPETESFVREQFYQAFGYALMPEWLTDEMFADYHNILKQDCVRRSGAEDWETRINSLSPSSDDFPVFFCMNYMENLFNNNQTANARMVSKFLQESGYEGNYNSLLKKLGIFSGLYALAALIFLNILSHSWNNSEEYHNENLQQEETETYEVTENLSYTPSEKVDLGLSVYWAEYNVGASSPEETGGYYAWGETIAKNIYTEENSRTSKLDISSISGNPAYDIAYDKWGSNWRIPTKAEFEELQKKCKWKWTINDRIEGYIVTGPNGNSIFLPAANYRYDSVSFSDRAEGCYWSSTPDNSKAGHAYGLLFSFTDKGMTSYLRAYGQSVRPVTDKK